MDFIEFNNMICRLKFRQETVDWLNWNYPQLNWFLAKGVMTPEVGKHLDYEKTLKCEKYKMSDFVFGPSLFFESMYDENWHLDSSKIEELLHAFAKWCLKIEFDKDQSKDLYLFSLIGELKVLDDDSRVAEITDKSLALVGVEWTIRGAI